MKQNKKITISQDKFEPFIMYGNKIPVDLRPENMEPDHLYFGILLNNKNIGGIDLWLYSSNVYMIDAFYIKAKYRNRGIGSQALQLLLKKYPKKDFCLNGLKEYKEFYEQNGFKATIFHPETQCYEFELLHQKTR